MDIIIDAYMGSGIILHFSAGILSLSCRSATANGDMANISPPVPVNECVAENENLDSTSSGSSFGFRSMSFDEKLTFVNFCTANLFVGAFYAVLGPFFPIEVCSLTNGACWDRSSDSYMKPKYKMRCLNYNLQFINQILLNI